MVKKLFALASVTALTGLAAATAASGCSSTTTDAGPADAAPEAKPPVVKPDVDEPETGPATCPITDPIAAADIEAQYQWKAPAAIKSDCNQKNIDDLKALFTGSGSIAFKDIQTKLGTTCSACVFSAKGAADWSIFAESSTSGTGVTALDNRSGSCFARLENDACGKAVFEFEQCLNVACSTDDCGTDQAKVDACNSKAQKGACKDLTDAFVKACPNAQDQADTCGNIFASIAISCAGGVDSGIDASTGQ